MSETTESSSSTSEETSSVSKNCQNRLWESQGEEKEIEGRSIHALQYNILCPDYAKASWFPHVRSNHLRWDKRFSRILLEIQEGPPDIIGMQELNAFDDFDAELSEMGYEGSFVHRPVQAKDGCGIWFNKNKFRLVDQRHIKLNRLSERYEILYEDMMRIPAFRFQTGHVANILLLEWINGDEGEKEEGKHNVGDLIIVANVHTFWSPDAPDVKALQVLECLEEIRKMSDDWILSCELGNSSLGNEKEEKEEKKEEKEEEGGEEEKEGAKDHLPVIFLGDFNSMPQSVAYALVTRGECGFDEDPFLDLAYELQIESLDEFKLAWNSDRITAPLRLNSSYVSVLGEEEAFTHWTPKFHGTLDYIFHSDHLHCQSVLRMPTQQELGFKTHGKNGLPNYKYPSDHISLQAKFQWKQWQ